MTLAQVVRKRGFSALLLCFHTLRRAQQDRPTVLLIVKGRQSKKKNRDERRNHAPPLLGVLDILGKVTMLATARELCPAVEWTRAILFAFAA